MNHFVNITDRPQLLSLLMALDKLSLPLWGEMQPQQMVEHLIEQVKYANGKKTASSDVPAAESLQQKQKWIYTDVEIPKNVLLADLPRQLIYADIQTAIGQLMKELDNFDEFFKQPGATTIHGGFGPMTYQEWLIWHGKHFTHHFKQFDLIAAAPSRPDGIAKPGIL